MFGSSESQLLLLLALVALYFIFTIWLAGKGRGYGGFVLPTMSGLYALWNYLKPMLIYNPYPTMREGMYMTFFGALAIVGLVAAIIIRYRKRSRD